MTNWHITNKNSGERMGYYDGVCTEAALDAMARDAGYIDYRDSCETVGDDPRGWRDQWDVEPVAE